MNTTETAPANSGLIVDRSNCHQSNGSLAVLNHIAQMHPEGCDFETLYCVFVTAEADAKAEKPNITDRNRLQKMLCNMRQSRWLVASKTRNSDAGRLWNLGPNIKTRTAAEPAPVPGRPAPKLPADASLRTPPRDCDVMDGPVYVPRHQPVLRPGALDFKRCPSRGF